MHGGRRAGVEHPAPAPANTPEITSTAAAPPTPVPQQPVSCPHNCTEAHNMGMSNMRPGHACYQSKFDRNRDGVARER